MITLGLLSIRFNQEEDYFTELAKRADSYNIQIVRFTPASIDPVTEIVHGLRFQPTIQQWTQESFPIPPYIYDRCFYSANSSSQKARPIVEWLKNRPSTTFLGYGLPSKLQTYAVLSKNRVAASYLPQTEEAESAATIYNVLMKERYLLLKPANGSQGNGIVRLTLERGRLEVSVQKQHEVTTKPFYKKEELETYLQALLADQAYMMQPLLSAQDVQGRPFDIRILLQKDKTGLWKEAGRGVRLGAPNHLISNLSIGSSVVPYEEWKISLRNRDIVLFEDDINTIIQNVPLALEEELPPLFEIGLDIAIDRKRAVWLLDVNSKPGRKVIMEANPACHESLFTAPLEYCRFLADSISKKGAERP
ncbi:YheC/YheD family protein [Bacillus sp. 165]|uniref:YheC/YheD family endospore coat-associated protein n=1 Tax=Bacillus sp. 165 TaxID=1529117 RepID=UPI001ADD3BEC|nr:YheC/YheD family protein [Bacillus sp. 165]MBO9128749.1 YheC/YheD family protein [Bacillus sp. 165]